MLAVGTLVLVLAGCGSGDSGGSAPTTVPIAAPTAGPEVAIQISGAHSGTFESTGSIFCTKDESGGPGEGFELFAMKMPEQFNLKMPRETRPGEYTISNDSGGPIDFDYTDPQRVKYGNITAARIQLTAVPGSQGERLVGSIEATLHSRKGLTVEIDVRLDLDAGGQSFDECD